VKSNPIAPTIIAKISIFPVISASVAGTNCVIVMVNESLPRIDEVVRELLHLRRFQKLDRRAAADLVRDHRRRQQARALP
jgi:hypothetical protein